MKIKIKNYFLQNPALLIQQNGFQNMGFIIVALNEFKYLRASTRVAYNIVKSIKEAEKATIELEETRISICKSLCMKDEHGNPVQKNGQFQFREKYVCPECEDVSEQEMCEKCNIKSSMKISKERDEFNDKYAELLQQEVELDIFPIKNSDIDGVQNVPIAAYETLLKHGFIQEEEEKKPLEKIIFGKP